MTRVAALLLVLLLASSLQLVHTSHEGRRLFNELDRAQGEQRRLDAEHKRLEAERQAQATHLRVERVARDKLGMHAPPLTYYPAENKAPTVASGAPR